MKKISVLCPAKINLTLDVLGVLDNGYHSVKMIMQSVSLFDKITVAKIKQNGIFIYCNILYVPRDERNIAYKAAQAFFEYTGTYSGINIKIDKKIPVGAGLAGGSTDAAGVLVALNILMNTNLSKKQLAEIGAKLGADIPFCIEGGTKLSEGIGEILTPLSKMPECFILLAKPKLSIQTKKVYSKIDEVEILKRPDTDFVIKALENNELNSIAKSLINVLEPVSSEFCSDIKDLKSLMLESSALGAAMSGSGSTVFGIFNEYKKAEKTLNKCLKITKNVFICKPTSNGVSVIE